MPDADDGRVCSIVTVLECCGNDWTRAAISGARLRDLEGVHVEGRSSAGPVARTRTHTAYGETVGMETSNAAGKDENTIADGGLAFQFPITAAIEVVC